MAEIDNLKSDLKEIQTARDNIKTALQNEGETVTNDIRTYASAIPNVNKVKTVNSVSADANKNIQIDASKINVDDTAETKQTVKVVIEELKDNINNISVPEYSVKETTVTEGYSKTYSLTKDGTEIGTKINIPKDLVVSNGSVKTVTTANTPYTGAVVGDKYIDIELNDPTQDHIYIPVKELVDVYTAGDGIEINASNVIKSKNSNLINGTAEGSLRSIGSIISGNSEGIHSFSEGYNTKATGPRAHTEGNTTTASGEQSHAEGYNTTASGNSSHAEGIGTISDSVNQHVQGKYNISDNANKYAHIVGNGTADANRSNAHTIDWEGNGWFAENVKIGGTGQDDTNAKQLATEEYVTTELNPVKTDISLIQNTVGGIFYWDGKNSESNPDNIQLWNNILNKHLEQDVLLYTGSGVSGNSNVGIAVLPKNKVNLTTDGQKTIDIGLIGVTDSNNSDVTYLSSVELRIILTITSEKVTEVKNTGTISSTLGQYLQTNYNYRNPYVPKYDGSPATKKYVDTEISTIKQPITMYSEVIGGWHMYSDGENLTSSASFTSEMYDNLKAGTIIEYPSSTDSSASVEALVTYVSYGQGYKSAGGRYMYKTVLTAGNNSYELSCDGFSTGNVFKGLSLDENSSGGGGGVACFTADTLVSTPEGLKKISEIELGDTVNSFNEDTKQIEIKTVDKLVNHLSDKIYKISVGTDIIETTWSHPFFTLEKGKCLAENLKVGDTLRTIDNRLIQITGVEIIEQPDTIVYEIRVEDNNNYFVGNENQVLVYNEQSVIKE